MSFLRVKFGFVPIQQQHGKLEAFNGCENCVRYDEVEYLAASDFNTNARSKYCASLLGIYAWILFEELSFLLNL